MSAAEAQHRDRRGRGPGYQRPGADSAPQRDSEADPAVGPQQSTTTGRRPDRRPSTVLLLALLVVLASLAVDLRVLPTDSTLGQDYNDFYVAAVAQSQGHNPYDGTVLTRIERITFGQSSFSNTVASPPAFFVLFRPLTRLSPRQGYLLWLLLSCGALGLAIGSLSRRLAHRPDLLIWALAISPPTVIALFLGQMTPLLAAVFIWATLSLAAGRPWLAGFLLALTLVKPHLMVVPDLLLCGLSWRQGGARAALALAAWVPGICLLATPFAEDGSFRHWLQALFTYGSTFDRWQPDISSLAGLYLPYLSRPAGRALSTLAVLAGLLCAALLLRWAGRAGIRMGCPRWWLGLALGSAVWLAVLPYVHPYDDILLLIPVLVLLAAGGWREPQGLALIAVISLLSLPELDLMGFRRNLTMSYTVVPVLATALALAGQLRRREAPEATAPPTST